MSTAIDTNSTLTVEQKFAKIMLHLRSLRPFYSAVYEVMEKSESKLIDSIGVTANAMVYNHDFVDKREFNQLVFIMLHEVGHTALQHVPRCENRDPKVWNVACDLYVNKLLSVEFGLLPGDTKTVNGIEIKMPSDGLFCSSIDLDNDYTEKIYDDLMEEMKKAKNKNNSVNRTSRFKTPGQNNQGQSGQGQDGQGQGGQSQGGQGQGGQGYYFEYHGSGAQNASGPRDYGKYHNITIRVDDSQGDLIHLGEDPAITKQKADKIISDAVVRVEMSSTDCGGEGGGLMGIVKKMMKSQLDWRKLLKKYLIAATSTDSSFNRPDKRMYYQKSIYPGQIQDEENTIKGLKVCIDTSGSVSDDDIAYFCGQVYDISKQFKIEAELIYWDTSVESTGEFRGYKEFERVDLIGRGGTDPSVVFNYFDSKKCKIKPVVTLMFTDGYFSQGEITSKQRRKYKDTIWVMTRQHDKNFTPTFGKKAIAKFS